MGRGYQLYIVQKCIFLNVKLNQISEKNYHGMGWWVPRTYICLLQTKL